MSLLNFTPEIWSARLLHALDKSLVYASPGIINRDYEGEISAAGDTVRINSIGDVTISDYTKNTDINAPEALTDAGQTLVIDQQKYFNFAVDDIDKAQNKPAVMDEAMRRAGYGLRDKADQYIASLCTDVAAANVVGLGTTTTPLVPSSNTDGTTVYDYLVDMGILLSEANIPTGGRWAVLPPWVEGRLRKDNRFVGYGTDSNKPALTNGMIGNVAGFEIYISNNCPSDGTYYKIIAGHPMAWSFAQQLLKMEAFRPERRFSDAMKGLHVYGAKVVRPDALSVGVWKKS